MAELSESRSKEEIVKYEYNLNIMSLEWWQKNIMYHVYLPSFKDSNDDGIGDFEGLMSNLEYFEYLGVKTLLLSPFYRSPMKDNGYDISSHIDIDPIYGTFEDFERFMEKVKIKDLNVIVDLVANHTSDQHEWFQKSVMKEEPYSDFYVWADAKSGSSDGNRLPPNNWLSVFGGSAWAWNENRKQFYLHQFLHEQPDLNFRNPVVREEIKKVMIFWLEKGVDGFRIDAASHLFEDELLRDEPVKEDSEAEPDDHGYLEHIYTKGQSENLDLLKELRKVLDEYEEKTGKAKLMVTEVVEDIKDVMKYYGAVGDRISDFPFNFQLYKLTATSTGIDLFDRINQWLKNMPKGKYPNWVMSSHDDSRIISRLGCRLASSLQMVIMLLPGIPLCYYGDELGMVNAKISVEDMKDSFALRTTSENSRDPMRTPMQWSRDKNAGFSNSDKTWLPVNENYITVNVEVEKEDPKSFLNLFQHLVKLREEPSILVGLLLFPLLNENVFSFLRFLVDAKSFLLVLNMSNSCMDLDMTNTCNLLPKEAALELSNGHLQEINDSLSKNKNQIKCTCKCHDRELAQNEPYENGIITVSLNHIHLKAKEAIVLSFYGERKD